MIYDVDYFIEKFSSIPEDEFITGDWENNQGKCANGHCGLDGACQLNEEANALWDLVGCLKLSFNNTQPAHMYDFSDYGGVVSINDGYTKEYPQETAKQRILAALNDIKKAQQSDIELIKEDKPKEKDIIVKYVAVDPEIRKTAKEAQKSLS